MCQLLHKVISDYSFTSLITLGSYHSKSQSVYEHSQFGGGRERREQEGFQEATALKLCGGRIDLGDGYGRWEPGALQA